MNTYFRYLMLKFYLVNSCFCKNIKTKLTTSKKISILNYLIKIKLQQEKISLNLGTFLIELYSTHKNTTHTPIHTYIQLERRKK